jgi:hypothetical protein
MQDLADLRTPDPKTAAKRLRTALKEKKIDLGHGERLDLVARVMGWKDWNVLSAKLSGKPQPKDRISVPEGWMLNGKRTQIFAGGLDERDRYNGHPVFWLRNETGEDGFATLTQAVLAEKFLDRRVSFSGYLRSDGVEGSATIFLRADDSRGRHVVFNNLETLRTNGSLRGTTPWSRREVVLDIPAEAQSLHFGFYLAGTGEARFCGLDLRIVGPEVPVTKPQEQDVPTNLDFSAAG